jgi:hypothetical protein
VRNGKRSSRLPVNVYEALEAIATTGKGRCWHCDERLPAAPQAIAAGWDVQRIDELPVASIILVCPGCLRRESAIPTGRVRLSRAESTAARQGHAQPHHGNGRVRPVLSLEPKRA